MTEVQAPRRPVLLVSALVVALGLLVGAGVLIWQLAAERDALRRELAAETTRVLDLRERLTRAEVALQEKEAALATRDAALAAANRPEIPVRVSFRAAWMGQGLVATIRNVSEQPLNVIADFRDNTAGSGRQFSLALDPEGTAEIGRAEGWTVTSGQSVTVSASGFRSITAFAP